VLEHLRRRKWNWLGQTLIRIADVTVKYALHWTLQGDLRRSWRLQCRCRVCRYNWWKTEVADRPVHQPHEDQSAVAGRALMVGSGGTLTQFRTAAEASKTHHLHFKLICHTLVWYWYGMVWYGRCEFIQRICHKVSNSLSTLVAGEKPGF